MTTLMTFNIFDSEKFKTTGVPLDDTKDNIYYLFTSLKYKQIIMHSKFIIIYVIS